MSMQALFIGQTYIDITFLTDRLPTGDEKHVASEYAVSFGGNAVTAAFCCAKLSIVPDLLTSVAEDWLGRMFLDMAAKHGIPIHPRKVNTSSLSFIMPREGKRAIVRCRDDDYLGSFPILDLTGCRALHVDGHQSDAAIYGGLNRSSQRDDSWLPVTIGQAPPLAFASRAFCEALRSRWLLRQRAHLLHGC
jgi:sugar/nucleoside kinase (ribokinase family)